MAKAHIFDVPAVPAPFLRLAWPFAKEGDKKNTRLVYIFPFATQWRLLACNGTQALLISWRDKENPCPEETAVVSKKTFDEDIRYRTALILTNTSKLDPLSLVEFRNHIEDSETCTMSVVQPDTSLRLTSVVECQRRGDWPWQFCGDPDGLMFGKQIHRDCQSPTNGYFFPLRLLTMLDLGKAGFQKWLKQYRTVGIPDLYEELSSSIWLAHKPSEQDPWGGPYQAAFARCVADRWEFKIDAIGMPLLAYGQGKFGAPLKAMADAPVWLRYAPGLCKVDL